jgi:uncharacterized protein (TIGR02145 family)
MFSACSDDKVAGGSSDDAGIIADLNVAGLTQKGPFAKGSEVTVRGIDCKTLKFTNELFESSVNSDNGEFVVDSVTLSSTCAIFEVSGYYLNEITGKTSTDKLTLHALTDLKDRKNVNINVLTELEYERVKNLVNEDGKSFAEAKKQAEREVLASFNIKGDIAKSEDLNIFEKGEGDAALLAVSVMMLADANESKFAERLDEFSTAISKNGSLDESAKTEIANLAATATENGKLDTIRKNIESWGYADDVPPFETYVKAVADGDSVTLDGKGDSGSEAGMTSSSNDVQPAETSSNSVSSAGSVSSSSSSQNVILSSSDNSTSSSTGSGDSVYFDWSLPKETYLNPKIKYDSIVDSRDGRVYKTVKIGKYNWMAENLNYTDSVKTPNLKENNWCYGDKLENCKVTGRLYSWSAVIAAGEHECGVGMSCKFRSRVQGICPSGWHLPDTSEWSELISAVNGRTFAGKMLKSQSGWLNEGNGLDAFGFSAIPGGSRVGYVNQVYEFEGWNAYFWSSTERDSALAYSMNMDTGLDGATYGSASKDYGFSVRCVENYVIASSSSSLSSSSRLAESSSSENFDWSVRKFEYLNLDKANYDEFKDKRDGKIYLTVEIGSHVWMAENLNYADSARTPSLKGKNWCYDNKEQRCDVAGRLYTWAAAIDSVALASNVGNPMTCGSKSPCALSGKVQGICPEGWHLPDTTEFRDLFNAAGGISELGAVLRSQTGWVESFMTPTDGLGFSAIPAGKRLADGNFRYVGSYTDFWSSTVRSQEDKVYSFIMSYSGLNENAGFATNVGKDEAISIRCVKD